MMPKQLNQNLTRVILSFEYGHSAGPLIIALTAPNLKELQMFALTMTLNVISLACDASSFLPKAGQFRMPNLETLSITATTRPVDIGTLLRSIPSLCKLSLGSETILDEDAIQGLANGELGPHLRDITLYDRISSSRRMNFYFVFRDCGNLELDGYERRISDLSQDGVIVQFFV